MKLRPGTRCRLATVAAGPVLFVLAGCGSGGATGDGEALEDRGESGVRVSGDTVFVDSLAASLVGLEVAIPPHRPLEEWLETTGQVAADPASAAVVSAPAEGRIESIAAGPGDLVSRGQPLVRFLSPEYLQGAVQLRAPRGGRVTARLAEVGQIVQAGTPLLEISDLRGVVLLVDLFPEMLDRVRPGMRVEARLPGEAEPLRGEVATIDVQVDAVTQAALARVPLPNAEGRLRPGAFARVRVQVDSGRETALVPAAAVVRDSAGQWAYVPAGRTADPRARRGYIRRRLEARAAPGDSMAILSGLAAGAPIVVRGAYQLHQAGFTFRGLVTFGEEAEEEEDQE